jgi:hypothetical protein
MRLRRSPLRSHPSVKAYTRRLRPAFRSGGPQRWTAPSKTAALRRVPTFVWHLSGPLIYQLHTRHAVD